LMSAAKDEAFVISKIEPTHFLQPSRYPGSGVTTNKFLSNDRSFVLLAGFFEGNNQIRLVRRDGSVVAKWPLKFSEIFKDTSHIHLPPQTDWNIDVHGALVLPDGSVVFNFEYGGLVKIDRFNQVVWTLPRETHHSVETAKDGGFWVCARRFHPQGSRSAFEPFQTPYNEDTILKVSEDGKVVREISVPKLFYDNGLESLLTSTGDYFLKEMAWDGEIVHLNKVGELSPNLAGKFPMFQAGDLIISLRKYNLLAVLSPKTRRIKWWRIGPWVRQHDPEFTKSGTIIIFDNNAYRTAFGGELSQDKSLLSIPRASKILSFNPNTGEIQNIYGQRKGQELLSVLRGKVQATPDNGLLITEFEGGRVFQTDAQGQIVWQYINRYDEDHVAEITEARLYPADYFTVKDWR